MSEPPKAPTALTAPISSSTLSSPAAPMSLEQPTEQLPDHITVQRSLGGLVIESRRRPWGFVGVLGVFCAIWDSVVIGMVISGPPSIFWVTHGGAGLLVTSIFLNLLINHTRIEIGHGVLVMRRAPLPWPERHEIELSRIKRLFVAPGETGEQNNHLPALWLEEHSGVRSILVDGLPDIEHAERLERLIEDHLQIDESQR